jgi:molybdenum cofactor cytidylyltransferase
MISAIVLAAGESKRMGRPKQLLEWQGKTLLGHVLESLMKSDAEDIVLVLGHEADRIGKSLPALQIKIVVNPDYKQGMASSLRQGLLAMDPRSEAFLVLLADQPGIDSEVMNRMIRDFQRADPRRGIVRPVYRGLRGHPVLIGIEYLQEALQLQGDVGARQILANHPTDILEIEVDQDGILKDIDTPEEYQKYVNRAGPRSMTLRQAFSIGTRESISLVGGGGKTTLLYALGRELSALGCGIILTTTTKILEPAPSPFLLQFLSNELGEIKKWVAENLNRHQSLLIARKRLPNGKLEGIYPEWAEEIFSMDGVSIIVNEADGAAGRPLKAPRDGEPVIPQNTTLLVPLIGIDGMGSPLDEEWVFRSAIASRLLNLPVGSTVTEDAITRLVMEWIKSGPAGARVVPLINKVDIPGGLEKAQKLARYLLSVDPARIRRVVLGQLQQLPAVKEVVPG